MARLVKVESLSDDKVHYRDPVETAWTVCGKPVKGPTSRIRRKCPRCRLESARLTRTAGNRFQGILPRHR